MGRWDIRKHVENGLKSEYIKYLDQLFEMVMNTMRKKSIECKKEITQFVSIFDVAELSFRQLSSVAGL